MTQNLMRARECVDFSAFSELETCVEEMCLDGTFGTFQMDCDGFDRHFMIVHDISFVQVRELAISIGKKRKPYRR